MDQEEIKLLLRLYDAGGTLAVQNPSDVGLTLKAFVVWAQALKNYELSHSRRVDRSVTVEWTRYVMHYPEGDCDCKTATYLKVFRIADAQTITPEMNDQESDYYAHEFSDCELNRLADAASVTWTTKSPLIRKRSTDVWRKI